MSKDSNKHNDSSSRSQNLDSGAHYENKLPSVSSQGNALSLQNPSFIDKYMEYMEISNMKRDQPFCLVLSLYEAPTLSLDMIQLNISGAVKSLSPLALDRTIFPCRTKKSDQKPAKPLNSLEDLAHTINERFVLAYPSQVVNNGALDSAPTWEESLINLDYFLAWA
ncbi:hypothetical protein DSO57_1029181 [Entomophthora muscae]|uniref:Uncharacterized protein n=1 Tax=Entomophthora muscae TaxID=34485 RepID=A0ACC2TN69_9FUNG|nr:hypothetical protein DSO57_1029181 [Entomophthora muscae]